MNVELFAKYLDAFPGIYLYLSDDIDEPFDYGFADAAEWTHQLYTLMYAKLPQVLKKVDAPLRGIISKIKPHQRSIEVERTMMNLIVLDAVVNDNFEFFRHTPVAFGKAISRHQFDTLRKLVINNFPGEKIKLLECELILGDYGKVRGLREALAEKHGFVQGDPDDFMASLFKLDHPMMCRLFPGIEGLTREEYYDLQKIKTGFHFGHMAHAEITEKELYTIKALFNKGEEHYLYENLIVQLFDVAGSMGHINGRLMLNHDIFEIYVNCMLPSLKILEHGSVQDAYHNYLYQRAALANIQFTPPEDMGWSEVFSLRLLCLMRITEEKDARLLFDVLDTLWFDEAFTQDAEFVINYQKDHMTPTYMPTVFNSMMLRYRKNDYPQKALKEVVKQSVHIIATGLKGHNHLVQLGRANIQERVNFNKLSHILKNHPEYIEGLIDKHDFVIKKSDASIFPAKYPIVLSDSENFQRI